MTDVTLLEGIVLGGDLSKLSSSERLVYYKSVCESLGLNPLTRPLEYIVLNGKLTLYARKDATDQLRQSRGVSITRLEREVVESVYVVTAYARDKVGREDSSIGAVGIGGLKGDALANAMMKAETKAKRRVTLSICGLGMLDETEVGTVPDAKPVPVDIETGEIVTPTPAPTRQVSASTQPQAPASPPAAISPVQVTALALALREAGFKNDEAGKLEGRDFLAFMAGLPALDSVKDLSREQAALLLDLLGSSEHDEQGQPVKGSYRADRAKLSAAVQKWADSKASAEFDDAAAAAVLGIDEVMSPAELKLYRAAADLE